jgi:HEAT repeat protein
VSEFKPDIWRLQAQFNTQGLVDALKNEDAGIRKRAAAALRALGAYHTITDLETALKRESDPETRANILAAIDSLQQEQSNQDEVKETPVAKTRVERLLEALETPQNDETMIRIVKALGKIGDKQAAEPLVMLFNNTQLSINIRLTIARTLLALESAPAEVALLGALSSSEWRVRRNGTAILGQIRATWAIPPLAKLLQDENEVVRRTALAALRNIGTKDATNAIEAVRRSVIKKKTATHSAVSKATEPKKPVAEAGKNIAWPERKATETRSRMVTRPLKADAVERLKKKTDQLNRNKNEKSSDDSSA